MTCETTTDFERAATRMEQLAYERPEFEDAMRRWLARGDDVLIYSNHDLGSLAGRMLGCAAPIGRDEPNPPHLWDGEWGLGWRYLPELRLTVEATP